MKVIIAGSRYFNDYKFLKSKCDYFLNGKEYHEIVSGCCRGVDLLGEKYAKEKGYDIKQFPAEWGRLGRKAGPLRNERMAKYADALIAFWDGKSSGTRNMINVANIEGLNIRIVEIKLG